VSNYQVIVVGAGGHAAVVADSLLAAGIDVIGFTDVDAYRHGRRICDLPVLGDDEVLGRYAKATLKLANGLGSLRNDRDPLRFRVQTKLEGQGWQFCAVVHPSASVSRFATIGHAAQVLAGCVVQAGAVLGAGVILNSRSIVEHDAHIGDWSHIAPGAVVCGDVRIGSWSHIGAGAVVRHGLRLGPQTLVGVGAAVVAGFSGNGVLVGVPARPMEGRV